MSRPWQSRVHGCTIYVRRPPSVASPSFNAFSADNIVTQISPQKFRGHRQADPAYLTTHIDRHRS